jgi:hypothetical protein
LIRRSQSARVLDSKHRRNDDGRLQHQLDLTCADADQFSSHLDGSKLSNQNYLGPRTIILDDAAPVQGLAAAAGKAVTLFPIRPALRFASRATHSGDGDTIFAGANPAYGAILNYYLNAPVQELRMEVFDSAGKTIRAMAGAPSSAGLHRIAWDLCASAVAGAGGGGRGGGRGGDGEGRGGGGSRGPQVLPGTYTVRLTADGAAQEQKVEVGLDPEIKTSAADLQAQWNAITKISTMICELTQMAQQADRHADSPERKAFAATITRPRSGPGSEGAPKLAEQLPALLNLIDGPNDAPTATMMKLLGELQDDYQKATAQFQTLKP